MPPTFLVFLGFIFYIFSSAIALVIYGPMLFVDSKTNNAKKVLGSVFISFPCLLIVGLFYVVIFLIPATAFFWITNSGFLHEYLVIILSLLGLGIFGIIVAVSALYFWFFMSKIISNKVDGLPIQTVFDEDDVFIFFKPYLIKLKLYNPESKA